MKTYIKSRNAQNQDDYETWVRGGISRTLNIFENQNDMRATVLVVKCSALKEMEVENPIGGPGYIESEVMYTLNTTEVHAICYEDKRNNQKRDNSKDNRE